MVPSRTNENHCKQLELGFTKYPTALWGSFKPSTAYVYIALRRHDGMRDGARPSIRRIETMTGLSRKTVQRAMAELVAAGQLEVEVRGDGTAPNLYRFPVVEGGFTMFENAWWTLQLSPAEAMTLLAIKHFSTMEHGAVPGGREMARMTKVGRNTINDTVVPALEARGVLEVLPRDWGKRMRSNSYAIKAISIEMQSPDLYGTEVTPHGTEMTPPCGTEMTPHGTEVTPHGTEMTPEEDSLNKIDQDKTDSEADSSNETDSSEPPRLRRSARVAQAKMKAKEEVRKEIERHPQGLAARLKRSMDSSMATSMDDLAPAGPLVPVSDFVEPVEPVVQKQVSDRPLWSSEPWEARRLQVLAERNKPAETPSTSPSGAMDSDAFMANFQKILADNPAPPRERHLHAV
jgi:DNA-binding transcriptional regulator YhcF (GntR family)